MSTATNLKRELIRRNLSVARLSELTGVTETSINKILSGIYQPSEDVLERFANGLGIFSIRGSEVQNKRLCQKTFFSGMTLNCPPTG